MATMVRRMLEQAAETIERYPGSRAAKRRAVSTSYYAVFHRLAEICANFLVPDEDRTSDVYIKVYRAPDHGPLRNAFQQNKALRDHSQIRLIAETVVELQSARVKADYMPAGLSFTTADAERYVARAVRAVDRIDALDDASLRLLSVHLLFRDRREDANSEPKRARQ